MKRIKNIFCILFYPSLVLFSGILVFKNILFSTGPALQIVDVKDLFFPAYYLIRKAFLSGYFPFWDPYTMLGQPCIFNIGVAACYPFLLSFLSATFLGSLIPRQIELFIVGHLLLSGFTMYFSARKLGLSRLGACIAGIVFQTAIVNRELAFYWELACGLPWVPLAITFGIIFIRSEAKILSKECCMAFIISIISNSLIISTTHHHFVIYSYMSLGISMLYFMVFKIKNKDALGALRLFVKTGLMLIVPLLLTAVIILPCSVVYKDSIRFSIPPLNSTRMFYLNNADILGMFLPGWIKGPSPFAYVGVITIAFAVLYCILKDNNDSNNGMGFLFVTFAVFWFYYAVEGSLIEKIFRFLPVLGTMRVTLFALVIYAYAIAILAAKGVENIYKYSKLKIRLNKNWAFPVFVCCIILFSGKRFLLIQGHGFCNVYMLPLFFGCFALMFLVFNRFIKSGYVRGIVFNVLPVVLLLEVFLSSPPLFQKSNHEEFFPYDYEMKKLESVFPECFLSKDLYRNENYCILNNMTDYYFERYGSYGFFCNGSQPKRYYYLWDKSGGIKGAYEKLKGPLNSKIFDLAGVKYFYLPEHEWEFVDYERSGQGEWVEAELFDQLEVFGIGIYNTPDPRQRRMLKAKIVLNDLEEILVDMPNASGWHKFFFEPIGLRKFRIVAEEVVLFKSEKEGTRGVVIGEVELLDKDGNKLDTAVKNFNASSTMAVSNPSCIMNNRLGHVWESGCTVLAEKTIPDDNLIRLREGCFINKNVFPGAFMVYEYRFFNNIKELAKEIHSESFKPDKEILVEGKKINYNTLKGPYKDEVKIVGYGLNKVTLNIKNDKPGFLILTDIYSPGWKVYVDGEKGDLLIADGIFRGNLLNSREA